MRESKIEKYFREQVREYGGRSYKFVSPQNRGVSDQIVLWPGGVTDFVELKTLNGKPSALQAQFRRELKKLGHRHFYIFSTEDVDLYIKVVGGKHGCKIQTS